MENASTDGLKRKVDDIADPTEEEPAKKQATETEAAAPEPAVEAEAVAEPAAEAVAIEAEPAAEAVAEAEPAAEAVAVEAEPAAKVVAEAPVVEVVEVPVATDAELDWAAMLTARKPVGCGCAVEVKGSNAPVEGEEALQVVVSGPQPYVEVTVAAVRSLLTEEQIAAYKAGDVSPAVVVFAAAEPQQWGSTEQPQWSEGPAQEGHKRLLVPMAKVGLVIGRGGETIKALQYQSGAHIQVLKMSDLAPNSQERPIDINGTPECIAKAEELIMAAINQQSYGEIQQGQTGMASGPASGVDEIRVPSHKIGSVIGRGGETIKALEAQSRARIQVQPDARDGERLINLLGAPEAVAAARHLIERILAGENPVAPGAAAYPQQAYGQQQQAYGGYAQQGYAAYAQPGYGGYAQYPQQGVYEQQQQQQAAWAQYAQQQQGGYPQQQQQPAYGAQAGGYDQAAAWAAYNAQQAAAQAAGQPPPSQ